MSNTKEDLNYLHLKCDYLLSQNRILQTILSSYLNVLCNDLNEFSGNPYNQTVHQLHKDALQAFQQLDIEWEQQTRRYREVESE